MKKLFLLCALVCAGSLISMETNKKQLSEKLWDTIYDQNTSIRDIVELLDKGADANYAIGQTSVLGKSIQRGNISIVKLLIQNGATPSVFDLKTAEKEAILEPNASPMKRMLFEDRSSQEKSDRTRILELIKEKMKI